MKHLSENAIKYMNSVWGFDTASEMDDMMIFWDAGEYEMVAKRLVGAGAVEPNCKEAREMIKVAKSVTEVEELEIIEVCFKNVSVVECTYCNFHHFIPGYCNVSDWLGNNACHSCGEAGYNKLSKGA